MLNSNTVPVPPLGKDLCSVGYKNLTLKGEIESLWYMFLKRLHNWVGSATNEINNKLNGNTTGGAGGWDDMRAPATAINPAGIVSAPTYDEANVGYAFNGILQQRIDVIFQLPHGWKRGSNIHPHIHVRPLANSSGNVIWQLQTSWSNNLKTQSVFTSANSNQVLTNSIGNIELKEYIFSLGNSVPPPGSVESSIVKYKLLRLGDADTYAGDVLFDEFDCHYYNEKSGTDPEYPT